MKNWSWVVTEEANTVILRAGDALIIVDLQNDFLPGGALAVSDGDQVAVLLAIERME